MIENRTKELDQYTCDMNASKWFKQFKLRSAITCTDCKWIMLDGEGYYCSLALQETPTNVDAVHLGYPGEISCICDRWRKKPNE